MVVATHRLTAVLLRPYKILVKFHCPKTFFQIIGLRPPLVLKRTDLKEIPPMYGLAMAFLSRTKKHFQCFV